MRSTTLPSRMPNREDQSTLKLSAQASKKGKGRGAKRDEQYIPSSSDNDARPTPKDPSAVSTRHPRTRRISQLPDSDDQDSLAFDKPSTPTRPSTSSAGGSTTAHANTSRDPARHRSKSHKVQTPDSDDRSEDVPLIPRGKVASETDSNDEAPGNKRKLQGLRWIERLVVKSMAEFKEIITARLKTQSTMHRARDKATREEDRGKKLDLQIKLVIDERWAMLPPKERMEAKSQMLEKDEEIRRLKRKVANDQGKQVESDRLLEAQKAKTSQAMLDVAAMKEKVLGAKRSRLDD